MIKTIDKSKAEAMIKARTVAVYKAGSRCIINDHISSIVFKTIEGYFIAEKEDFDYAGQGKAKLKDKHKQYQRYAELAVVNDII